MRNLKKIFPISYSILNENNWKRIKKCLGKDFETDKYNGRLAGQKKYQKIPDFLPELAKLEWSKHKISSSKIKIPENIKIFKINPFLDLHHLSWELSPYFKSKKKPGDIKPRKKEEWILICKHPDSGEVSVKTASKEELFILKVIADGIPFNEAAEMLKTSVDVFFDGLFNAGSEGVLLVPSSKIKRNKKAFITGTKVPDSMITAESFTLQWHITHACDLHCKHCYDRTKRSQLPLDQMIKILDDLKKFCRERYVSGHVCFTGGNPFLRKDFFEIYRSASEYGFSISILGNPVSLKQINDICKIQKPGYFQVSLEGLAEHNDLIRGSGHFKKVVKFLKILKKAGIPSAVMLTLTKDNIYQVLPLADKLKKLTDNFTFNRLSMVGEGASLCLPDRDKYISFLERYIDKAKYNPIIGLKDNMINIMLNKKKRELFDGCTGYGCGAAFNFLAILPDGEVHACRKFPSLVGNILKDNISEIYYSKMAKCYRNGPKECNTCKIRAFCGGCMAISYSHGLNIFKKKDPYCFI